MAIIETTSTGEGTMPRQKKAKKFSAINRQTFFRLSIPGTNETSDHSIKGDFKYPPQHLQSMIMSKQGGLDKSVQFLPPLTLNQTDISVTNDDVIIGGSSSIKQTSNALRNCFSQEPRKDGKDFSLQQLPSIVSSSNHKRLHSHTEDPGTLPTTLSEKDVMLPMQPFSTRVSTKHLELRTSEYQSESISVNQKVKALQMNSKKFERLGFLK